jgi:hypothetical protein
MNNEEWTQQYTEAIQGLRELRDALRRYQRGGDITAFTLTPCDINNPWRFFYNWATDLRIALVDIGARVGEVPDTPTTEKLLSWVTTWSTLPATQEEMVDAHHAARSDKQDSPAQSAEKSVTPSQERAWQSYRWVSENHPHLLCKDGKRHTKGEYEAAVELSPQYTDDDGKSIARPSYASWKRYLRGFIRNSPKVPCEQDIVRPEEVADRENIDQLGSIAGRYNEEE